MDRRAVAVLAAGPFVTLAGVLRQLPDWLTFPADMPWRNSIVHSLILLGLVAAHSVCYGLWQPHAPNRILVNEFLTRLWFALLGLLAVGATTDYGGLFLVMAAAWAVASWCVHYLLLRMQGTYRVDANIAMLGLFLLGLALMAMVCLQLQAGDEAARATGLRFAIAS